MSLSHGMTDHVEKNVGFSVIITHAQLLVASFDPPLSATMEAVAYINKPF